MDGFRIEIKDYQNAALEWQPSEVATPAFCLRVASRVSAVAVRL